MFTNRLRRIGIIVLVLAGIAIPFVIYWFMSRRRSRLVLDFTYRYESGQALIRYIQVRNQCSEEEAYQRLATFVKRHASLFEQTVLEYMLAFDRQGLLEIAQRILMDHPAEIDEI